MLLILLILVYYQRHLCKLQKEVFTCLIWTHFRLSLLLNTVFLIQTGWLCRKMKIFYMLQRREKIDCSGLSSVIWECIFMSKFDVLDVNCLVFFCNLVEDLDLLPLQFLKRIWFLFADLSFQVSRLFWLMILKGISKEGYITIVTHKAEIIQNIIVAGAPEL